MNIQNVEFAERIARIEAGQNSFRSTIFVGNEEVYRPDQMRRVVARKQVKAAKTRPATKKHSTPKPSVLGLFGVPLAAVLGAIAMLVWHVIEFQGAVFAGEGLAVQQAVAVNAAAGTGLAILLGQGLGLTSPQHILAAFVGLIAMTFGLTDMVAFAPDQFASVISSAWVADVLTQPNPMELLRS